ncbi:MAG: Mo-dependent nitrogenase C-terminal domain-containing protein [Mastigocoleus sp. MO_167.B18]|nr:Mo-dependent nitrogenase C-terminal domain-containing protein [Mastigocoleus sp. MO_167.B18]
MKVFDNTTKKLFLASWVSVNPAEGSGLNVTAIRRDIPKYSCDIFRFLRQWLNNIQICDRKFAHRICGLIPAQCPFEREIKLFGKTLFYIPPLCKLNPLYEELVSLRFRALCYLADECGEDITQYC